MAGKWSNIQGVLSLLYSTQLQFVNQVKLIRYLRGSTQERRKQIALLFLLLRDLQKVLAIGRFDHQIMIFSHLDLIWHFSSCHPSQYWSLVSRLDLQKNKFRGCNYSRNFSFIFLILKLWMLKHKEGYLAPCSHCSLRSNLFN